ncbi:MAG TPA: GAF domain-containing protein, partial [Ktedonobacteraceae bacterium]
IEQADALFSDPTLIVVPRDKLSELHLDESVVNIVRRLLAPLYEDRQNWSTWLGQGMKDLVQPDMDRASSTSDAVLTRLADMVVHLGGKLPGGETRWHHCCILLPDETYLPLQERRLKVKAVNQSSAKLMDVMLYPLEHYNTTVSIRAFLGTHILYHDVLTGADTTEKLARLEGPVRSCIAVPIGGEVTQPLGILYVASYQEQAFSKEDQRLLRLIAHIAEEILRSYEVRQHVSRNLSAIMEDPTNTDTLFANFFSEDRLIHDIEALLANVQERKWVEQHEEEPMLSQEVSFIAVELNDQENLHNKYDYLLLRNIYLRVGELIDKHFRSLFSLSGYTKPCHIYGSRYYIFLPGVSLLEARKEARKLKKALDGSYTFTSLYVPTEDIVPLSPAQHLADMVANIGIASYSYTKLEDILQRYPGLEAREVRIVVRNTVFNFLDVLLKQAQKRGGNIIVSWDPDEMIATLSG